MFPGISLLYQGLIALKKWWWRWWCYVRSLSLLLCIFLLLFSSNASVSNSNKVRSVIICFDVGDVRSEKFVFSFLAALACVDKGSLCLSLKKIGWCTTFKKWRCPKTSSFCADEACRLESEGGWKYQVRSYQVRSLSLLLLCIFLLLLAPTRL